VRSSASDLIRCLLAGDPSERAGLDFVEQHPFLALPKLTADTVRASLLSQTHHRVIGALATLKRRAGGAASGGTTEQEEEGKGAAAGEEGGMRKRPRQGGAEGLRSSSDGAGGESPSVASATAAVSSRADDERSRIDSALSLLLLNTDLRRARYRFFISHAQADAAGSAKALYNFFDRTGVSCW